MKDFLRLVRGEFRKLPHTPLLFIHLIIPLIGIAVFLWYYSVSAWNPLSKITGYFQVLGCSWCFLNGLVCGMSTEMEENLAFQNYLFFPARRLHGFLAKWTAMSLLGLFSSFIAVGGFVLGFSFIDDICFSPSFYVRVLLVLWAGQLLGYMLHLALGLFFGKTAAIGAGLLGTLLSCLFLTGLGDGRWMFVPWSWSSRFFEYMILYNTDKSFAAGYLTRELSLCGVTGIVLLALLLFGAAAFEGRRTLE